jgi:hypothetical protein
MLLSGVNQAGMRGLQYGMEGLRQNAADLTNAQHLEGSSTSDISKPLLNEHLNLQQVKSALKVMNAENKLFRTTLDITA